MMALHHRKILFADDKKPEFNKKFSSDCYMCYVCPENCYVSPPPPQLSQPDPVKNHVSIALILMLCVLGVAFIVLSHLTIARYRLRNSRRRNSESLENSRADFLDENQWPVLDHPIWYIRTVGLPQSVIDSIASFEYRKGNGLIEGNDCSVCLNEFQENESLRLLPKCSHAFHVACIDTWLRSHKNCPVCRAPVLISPASNARVSSVESSSSSFGSADENQGGNELESRRGVETGGSRETRGGVESRGAMPVQEDQFTKTLSKHSEKLRALSDLADHRVKVDQELQPVRRSVSMDLSCASMIYQAAADTKDEGCSDTQLDTIDKQKLGMIAKRDCKNSSIYRMMVKSSSCARSLQNRPVSMKRSFSFSGKRSLRKNSRSQESIRILEISTQNRSQMNF